MATATSPRRRPTPPAPSSDSPETVADLLRRLGNIPARRVRLHPTPGTATLGDAVAVNERKDRTALCELVDGTLVEKPTGFDESVLAMRIGRLLGNFVEPRNLGLITGEAGMMVISGGLLRMPDVAFIARTSFPRGEPPKGPAPEIAPDLAVEVLSNSNTKAEIARKLREYFASGTRLAWIVDPKTKSVRVHTAPTGSTRLDLATRGVLDGGDVLPGFRLPLADVFANAAD
jgi:Uma2 family endonuclease